VRPAGGVETASLGVGEATGGCLRGGGNVERGSGGFKGRDLRHVGRAGVVSGILGVVLQDEESLASGIGELENDLEAGIQLWEEQYARVLVHDGYLLNPAFVHLDGVDVTVIRGDALH
jgi:hypothetical protein